VNPSFPTPSTPIPTHRPIEYSPGQWTRWKTSSAT